MADRVIAIGDIHGCAPALATIVREIKPDSSDTLIILGDCVDRGPDSAGVIEQLLTLREKCRIVPLLGNHEEMMLNYIDGRAQPDNWLLCGGDATLNSYIKGSQDADVPQGHLDFIRTFADYFETPTHFFVHAAYHPQQQLSEQRWQMWRWHSLRDMVPAPHVSGKTAIVGHTSQKNGEILDVGHLVCIDTFCFAGGWLTALEPATGDTWQADRDGRLRQK